MFTGSYPYRVDEKGRTKLPASFTSRLGERFILTKGMRGCLWLLPLKEWERVVSRLQSESLVDHRAHALQRFFLGHAVETALDGQGRLSIPTTLRDHAGVRDEMMVVGAGGRIEIWARDRWDEYNRQIDDLEIEELGRSAGL